MTQIFQSINPATGEPLWEGEASDAGQVNQAVANAKRAFADWSLTSLEERITVLERYSQLLADNRDMLARAISQEMGKVYREAYLEAGALVSKIAISIDAYHTRTGSTNAEMDGGVRRALSHRPLGVMAVFGPFNFPMHLPNGHMVPALLAGNTIVFKPSEQTPKCGELLVSLLHEAGLPDGVVNLVQGMKETGAALTSHPDVAGVLFTGSYQTGKQIHKSLAGKPEIMLALEMGGNNPLIVRCASDVEATAALIVDSAYVTTGQRCTCARRVMLPTGTQGDAIIEAVAARIDAMIVAEPFATEPEPYMSCLVNTQQAANTLKAQDALLAQGGKAIRMVEQSDKSLPFVTAGLVDMTDATAQSDDETFAPLLQVMRIDGLDDAIAAANNTAYGLSAGLISDDVADWEYVYPRLRAGLINFNRPLTGAASAAPFGGTGHSGNLRPSAYYAADYCAYPVASLISDDVIAPALKGFA